MGAGAEPPADVDFELRVLSPDDWGTWRVVRLDALATAPYAFSSLHSEWAEAPEERWRARLELPGSHNLVAFTGTTPVGMATGLPGGEAVELISMYVAASVRGTGVAGALIEAIEDWASARGARQLCLDVRTANTAARRLYERQGFVVVGEVERSSDEAPELRMSKEIRT